VDPPLVPEQRGQRLPRRVGQPFVTRRSFTATGTPSSGDSGSPASQRASDASAIASEVPVSM